MGPSNDPQKPPRGRLDQCEMVHNGSPAAAQRGAAAIVTAVSFAGEFN